MHRLNVAADSVTLIFQRKTIAFPRHMEGVLRHVASGQLVEVGSIPDLEALERMLFAQRLVREGFLTIVR